MVGQSKATAPGHGMVQAIRRAFARKQSDRSRVISQSVFIEHADERPPTLYTVDFIPTAEGTFLVCCRDLPQVMFRSRDVAGGLMAAEMLIEEAIGPARVSD
jgi:hypothetical protein